MLAKHIPFAIIDFCRLLFFLKIMMCKQTVITYSKRIILDSSNEQLQLMVFRNV